MNLSPKMIAASDTFFVKKPVKRGFFSNKDYFSFKQLSAIDKWNWYRKIAKKQLSSTAQMKLEWVIFYYTVGKQNVANTAAHFGIARKTLHKWLKRFDERILTNLEEQTKAPHTLREWMITKSEETAIITLRKKYMNFGRKKLQVLYRKEYRQDISPWKISRIIKKYDLFPYTAKEKLKLKTRRKLSEKTRIHHMKETIKEHQDKFGYLWHVDTVIIWWYAKRRCIFTAIEDGSRLAFARVYSNNTASSAEDFLKRLLFLVDGNIEIMHSDNGSEFAGAFEEACTSLSIQQIYSRPHTPKDNAKLERFNATIQKEWLDNSIVGLDNIIQANTDLTEWLVVYNSIRPHAGLNYLTPLEEVAKRHPHVLPMSPVATLH